MKGHLIAWRDDSWKHKRTWLLLLCCGWEQLMLPVFSVLQHHGQLLQTHPNLSKHSTACFCSHLCFLLCEYFTKQAHVYQSYATSPKSYSKSDYESLRPVVKCSISPVSIYMEIVYEMFNGLTQVCFMFWTQRKKECSQTLPPLFLMQHHTAVAWAVIKRRATTRMHAL